MSLPFLAQAEAAVKSMMVTPLTIVTPASVENDVLDPETLRLARAPEQERWSGLGFIVPLVDGDSDGTHRVGLPLDIPDDLEEGLVVVGPEGRYVLTSAPEIGTYTVVHVLNARKEPTRA